MDDQPNDPAASVIQRVNEEELARQIALKVGAAITDINQGRGQAIEFGLLLWTPGGPVTVCGSDSGPNFMIALRDALQAAVDQVIEHRKKTQHRHQIPGGGTETVQ